MFDNKPSLSILYFALICKVLLERGQNFKKLILLNHYYWFKEKEALMEF